MNKYTIGKNADTVWRLMNSGTIWNYDELREKSGLSEHNLYIAIGWLARENKIEFDETSQDKKVYLNFNPYM